MLRARFFWKLFSTYAALVLATTLVIGFLVHGQLERWLAEAEERTLQDKALFAELSTLRFFQADPPRELESEVRRVGGEAGIRLTLIREDGVVFADSAEDPSRMENHGARAEVLDARAHVVGVSRRHSSTVHDDRLYVARAVRPGERLLGFVRVSIPLSDVDAKLRAMRVSLLSGAGLVIVFAMLLGVWMARRTTAPLMDMNRVAQAMRSGRYDERVRNIPNDEVGVLAATMNELGVEVTNKIATISQEQAQLKAMLSGMVEGVLAVGDDDQVLFCNRAACELLELDESTAAGRRVWEITRISAMSELIAEARRTQRPVRSEMTLRNMDREVVLETHATPFRGGGEQGVVVALHDITNLRRLERIRRDFVANVSHELKTPLTSIKGYVETLLSGALHDEQNNIRFLKKIDDNASRLTNLVHDLLSLASIESQEGFLALAPVEAVPIINAVLRRQDVAIKQKGLTVTVDLQADPVAIQGDAEAVTQILDNLLDNAIKYTPTPGQLTVRLSRRDDQALLEVADSGIGIPEKDLERVFERFYRVDKARSRELGGTGLGLSIVKHLVQAMHGEIRVASTLGKGSCFAVLLPLASPAGKDYPQSTLRS